MLFQVLILLSTLSKMSNYMVTPQKLAWEPSLLYLAPSTYVKMSGSQALLKKAPNLLFFKIPTSL